jgi:hypothetical protein
VPVGGMTITYPDIFHWMAQTLEGSSRYLLFCPKFAEDCGELMCSRHPDSIHNHCYVYDLVEGCGDHVKIESDNVTYHCENLERAHFDQPSTVHL